MPRRRRADAAMALFGRLVKVVTSKNAPGDTFALGAFLHRCDLEDRATILVEIQSPPRLRIIVRNAARPMLLSFSRMIRTVSWRNCFWVGRALSPFAASPSPMIGGLRDVAARAAGACFDWQGYLTPPPPPAALESRISGASLWR